MNPKCLVANHVTAAPGPEPGTEKAFGYAANATEFGHNSVRIFI